MTRPAASGLRCGGFTLLELILVIVLLSVAAVPILGGFNQVGRGLEVSQDGQIALQLVQEQAENLLADKRNLGFADPSLNAGITLTVLAAPYARYDRTVTIVNHTSVSLNGCPNTGLCKLVTVDVNLAGGGRLLATTSFMVVQ